ncbi:non-canonical purine NTP pyrophosphatase [Acidipila sp. EB88]|uniref:non-canonical purine NTP pyrophosphatase n=1 Tax=Acidipila sp. EB88 TaxID=2305226 RepID=UPI000F5E146F|nr:non-canonical purine NTP pyrophosphatase [Acidipila sp. EB88]RRA47127.1 non-canonical purine NTP pyrophosphatase [Acidipila sp. EB88]
MNQRTLYVASGNRGKLRDFSVAAAAGGSDWKIAELPGLEGIAPPPEDGETFQENAEGKALYYGGFLPGAYVLADDSGLVVDALGGAPGVYSARYADRLGFATAGSILGDERNNLCLLAEMRRLPVRTPRAAHYRCVLAVAQNQTIVATAEGTVAGVLLEAPQGGGGFGYDPLFLLPGYGRSMAELDAETRLGLSHRGAALRALLRMLPA